MGSQMIPEIIDLESFDPGVWTIGCPASHNSLGRLVETSQSCFLSITFILPKFQNFRRVNCLRSGHLNFNLKFGLTDIAELQYL